MLWCYLCSNSFCYCYVVLSMGLLSFAVYGVLLNVLSRSVISFFRRRSLDESALRSVNLQIATRKNENTLPVAYF